MANEAQTFISQSLKPGEKMSNLLKPLVLCLLFLCSLNVMAQERQETSTPQTQAASISTRIPANSKVFIHPMEGFETYVTAAIQKKKLPLIIVADREQADFEIKGSVEKQKASWAKTIFISPLPSIDSTMQVINVKTGVVAYSISSTKANARRGRKGSAEHLAKNLVKKMKADGDMQ